MCMWRGGGDNTYLIYQGDWRDKRKQQVYYLFLSAYDDFLLPLVGKMNHPKKANHCLLDVKEKGSQRTVIVNQMEKNDKGYYIYLEVVFCL